MSLQVAILGASNKTDRFAYKALKLLVRHGHKLFPINPSIKEIDGIPVWADLSDLKEPIDTLTVYVGPQISSLLKEKIILLNPRRIIFNPGSENVLIEPDIRKEGIEIVLGCTLVMLNANEF